MSKYFLAVTVGDVQKYVEVFEGDFLNVVDNVSGIYTINKKVEDSEFSCTTYYYACIGKYPSAFGFTMDLK